MKVLISADIGAPYIWGVEARAMIKSIMDYNIQIRLENIKQDHVGIDVDDTFATRLNLMCHTQMEDIDVHINVLHPHNWRKLDCYNIGVLHCETSLLTPRVVEKIQVMNEVWVFSPSHDEGIRALSNYKGKVTFLPFPIDDSVYGRGVDKMNIVDINCNPNGDPATGENVKPIIGYVGRWSKASNVELFLASMLSNFTYEDAAIIIKTYDGAMDQSTDMILRERINTARKQLNNTGPNITLVTHALADEDMARLYNTMNVVVMTSRGAGPPAAALQALACGCSVVAPLTSHQYIGDHQGISYANCIAEYVYGYSEHTQPGDTWWVPDSVELSQLARGYLHEPKNSAIAIRDEHGLEATGKRIMDSINAAVGEPVPS